MLRFERQGDRTLSRTLVLGPQQITDYVAIGFNPEDSASRMQAAVHQGVLGCVALFVVPDFCVSRASQRSTFCFFSAPGTAK